MSQMTENRVADSAAQTETGKGRLLRWLLPVVVILVGVIVSMMLIDSGPKASMAKPPVEVRLVTTQRFSPATEIPTYAAMGQVIAAHESVLYPQVEGMVVAVSDQLMPGGQFKAGEEILRIDDADYQLSLRKQQASVAEAQAALQEELGQQAVAKREYELLGRHLEAADKALVLRQPQLASARATLASAKAERDQASLDVQRSRVTAPFDGMVLSRNVDLGTRVTNSTELLTLINVDTFWVEVSVPVSDLSHMMIPTHQGESGARVELYQASWDANHKRLGRVLRLIPALDSDSRMARLLIELDDPLGLRAENAGLPPIMVNDYIRVRIAGKPMTEVVNLPRNLLRDGDNVWIMTPDNTLEIRPVEVAYRAAEQVFISRGVGPDDKVITIDFSTPVAGMALREQADEAASRDKPVRESANAPKQEPGV
ncbi:efflux RND transporter periplasmic adaptor subunit [Amphritea opalescens]|uniref:Efflux RND transporter periplasmic adaptor subunit n=1 Tax=Amphritea opalescens TaxID=2490544 RepID=A0A430KNP7_9GAMM|nr:efflux RND transporter periplasmic adaptor subunit [Amphritea opalescens]RTE65117.1 efflux RND transporter periplasmic adaptor subunit [Amphritea opalescens]